MKLTRSLDIGVQVLIQLARSGKQMSVAELAKLVDAPRNHVVKVTQILARGAVIRTLRGKGGGIRLARPAGQVLLEEIVNLIEGPLYLMECTSTPAICAFSRGCRLRLKLREVEEAMKKIFRSTTLNDLLPGAQEGRPRAPRTSPA